MENKIILDTETIQRISRRNGYKFGYTDNQTNAPTISEDMSSLLLLYNIGPKERRTLACLEYGKSEFRFDGYGHITTVKREVVANYIDNHQWEVAEEVLLNKFI